MVHSATWYVLVAAISLAAIAPVAAQTLEPPAIAKTDTLDNALEIQPRAEVPPDSTAKIDAATEIEIQRRFNDLRSELLDDHAESITWWLATVAVLFTLWGLVIAIGGLIGYREFRALRDEARKSVKAIEKEHGRVSELAEESEKYRNEVMENAKAVEEQAQATQGGDRLEETREAEEAVEEVGESPEASPLDEEIDEAYALQRAGNLEAAIEKWRSIANNAENTDRKLLAARAWIAVGNLLRKKEEQKTEEGGTK